MVKKITIRAAEQAKIILLWFSGLINIGNATREEIPNAKDFNFTRQMNKPVIPDAMHAAIIGFFNGKLTPYMHGSVRPEN
ncbi:hypothetical protein NL293_27745, partial [Klebsiella pneumoniae]|nr:hypothetical protein [Klebsiella pneumoniae]